MKRSLIHRHFGAAAVAVLACGFAGQAFADADAAQTTDLSGLVVTAPSPGATGIDPTRSGTTSYVVTGQDFDRSGSLSVTDALGRFLPGVNIADTQGNAMTNDVNYRGFTASPVQGAPQGLAVYLNGQRLNEPFGDTVNWDLIPQQALNGAELVTNNPAFGLNALGGSLNLITRDGFSFHGLDAQVEGGSFGSWTGAAQGGVGNDKVAAYLAVDGGHADGWRPQSESQALRGYGDVGFKLPKGELHLTAGASDTRNGVVGPTPVDLLEGDRRAIFTWPQTTHNKAQFAALTGSFKLGSGWSAQAGVHWRGFNQAHVDGNDGDFEQCDAAIGAFLCLEDDGFPSATRPPAIQFEVLDQNNNPIPCPVLISNATDTRGCRNRINAADGPRVPYGTLDRTFTASHTWGGSFQLGNETDLAGHKNSFVAGVAYDKSGIHYRANSTLGLITPDLEVVTTSYPIINITAAGVPGLGSIIHAGNDVAYGSADVHVDSQNTGVYVSDTIDLTQALSMTVGGRYNDQTTDIRDLTGTSPLINGDHKFTRFNPAVNLAWRTGVIGTVFGGYSETNRAPTPLELGCSDPTKPCLLENSLVADPPLKQVVSKTFEIGVRGDHPLYSGIASWSFSAFSTNNDDDIISLASTLPGRGYYANVPKTRRQGGEAEARFDTSGWGLFANLAVVDAEYRFDGTLSSPNNPQADGDGNIDVQSGDKLGGIPKFRFKFGGEVHPITGLTIGADADYTGRQYFVGDEGNDNDKLPSYWTASLRADYEITKRITVFGRITNLFDSHYASFGTYFDADGVQKVRPQPLPADPEEESLTPNAPRAFYIGLKAKF